MAKLDCYISCACETKIIPQIKHLLTTWPDLDLNKYFKQVYLSKTLDKSHILPYFIKNIDLKDPNTLAFLAMMYKNGCGVEVNLFTAAELMQIAARLDIKWAKWEYYEILWKMNTPESLKTMIEYGQAESDKGNMELRARLARAYRDGKGVERDLNKAAELMKSVLPGNPAWAKWEYLDILKIINTAESDKEAFDS